MGNENKGKKKLVYRAVNRFVKLIDLFLITAVFAYVWTFYYADHIRASAYSWKSDVMIIAYALLFYYFARLYKGFALHLCRISELIGSQILALIISNFLILIVLDAIGREFLNVLPLLLMSAVQCLVIIGWSFSAHRWYFGKYPPSPTLIVYDEREGIDRLLYKSGFSIRYQVVRKISVDQCNSGLEESMKGIETVFLCGIHSHERNQILKYCVANDIDTFVIPRIGDVIMSGASRIHLLHLPMLYVQQYNPSPEYLFFKRFFDIVLSLLGLIILSPLYLIIAIAVKATDGGTVLYRQRRLTQYGREFDVLKFRSMRMDAEKDGVARLSTGDADPRITKVGRFIRACRMDELPQLINILKGDMSIVGPRPECPEISAQYEQQLPEWPLRLQCKCGLTGYAQIYGQYNTTPYDKLMMDLMYISHPSLAEDFKICFATVKILFMKESTEGVAEGQTTAEAGKPEIEESVGQESVSKTV